MQRTRFLCDSCKYDYDGACTRPERPNAIRCPDYAPAGRTARARRTALPAKSKYAASGEGLLGWMRRSVAAFVRVLGRPWNAALRAARRSRPGPDRSAQASKAVDELLKELDIDVAPDPTDEPNPPEKRDKR